MSAALAPFQWRKLPSQEKVEDGTGARIATEIVTKAIEDRDEPETYAVLVGLFASVVVQMATLWEPAVVLGILEAGRLDVEELEKARAAVREIPS